MIGKLGDDGPGRDFSETAMATTNPAGRTAPVNWDVIRQEYETRSFLPAMICRRHGITAAQLRYRRESEGWLSCRARIVTKVDLVARMLKVFDKQIRQLEAGVNEPIDKQANVLAIMTKTLEKLIEMGASEHHAEPPARQDMADLRDKLAERLDQFKNR